MATEEEERQRQAEEGETTALRYESNPKHKEPWQPGRKGSLCEAEVHSLAHRLLKQSILWDNGKRYAVYNGMAYCAQENAGQWHGYPVGWREVPPRLALQMRRQGLVSKRQLDRYWRAH